MSESPIYEAVLTAVVLVVRELVGWLWRKWRLPSSPPDIGGTP